MKNIFKETIFNRVKRSKFDLSHDRKFSCDMGELVPIALHEVLPGDKFEITSNQMIKLAPMLSPVMHRVDVFTHFFFVPNRLVWPEFEDFISPDDPSNVPKFPIINEGDYEIGSIADYMGVPTGSAEAFDCSAIPIAGYNKIFNEYYRDQNLVDPVPDTCEEGDNNPDLLTAFNKPPLKRAWDHDYFTSCLPFAQKGDPVTLPLGTDAPITYQSDSPNDETIMRDANGDPIASMADSEINTNSSGQLQYAEDGTPPSNVAHVDNSKQLRADLSNATAATINDWRNALSLQEWLELNARGGTRYTESILAHFGVRSKDARLQRPEYLGGGKSPVMISEVLQTSAAASEPTPLATMSGHGLNVGSTHQFKRKFTEHGYIFGIMSVMPKTAYFQGLPKHMFKFETLDFAFPSFAHLGEQEVLNKELHIDHAEPDGTFGYIPRYSEYRYTPSSVHGDMRTTFDYWHMARDLPDNVALNADFIQADPTKRIFASQGADDVLWCHIYNQVTAIRPLPKYGIPKT